jgi:hypothetical protein
MAEGYEGEVPEVEDLCGPHSHQWENARRAIKEASTAACILIALYRDLHTQRRAGSVSSVRDLLRSRCRAANALNLCDRLELG